MFPGGYFPISYFPPSYFPKTGGVRVGGGAGGQIVAERYRRVFRALMAAQQERSVLTELARMRAKEGKRSVEVLNHLQIRAEEANRQATQRAAIMCALLAEV